MTYQEEERPMPPMQPIPFAPVLPYSPAAPLYGSKSIHDHSERRLPDKFVQRFALVMERKPEAHNPIWEYIKAAFGKKSFTMKTALDNIATDVRFESWAPEEIEQRIYTLRKQGYLVEV